MTAHQSDSDELTLSSQEFDDHALVVLASRDKDTKRWLLTVAWADVDGPTDFGRAFDLPGELRREDVHDMARIYMLAFSKGLAVASKGVKP